ncbi:hypothetical protein HDU76_004251 [Blyttiomyces sp. JEL0837]|nr:hypothetical protein HDU76_004251 [Blyttiomyces sp. JEL0837]
MFSPDRGDPRTQFVINLVRNTEKNVGKLQAVFAGYLRNQERLRRKSLKMSTLLKAYSDTETSQFKALLQCYSGMLAEVEKEREKMMERMQALTEGPLKMYPAICSKVKEEARTRENALDKEMKKQQQLDKVMMKDSGNRPKISQSQMELAGATHEVSHATNSLLDSVRKFEVKKRDDLKASLSEAIWSEMNYHARVLEILGVYHQEIGNINFEEDFAFEKGIEERITGLLSPTALTLKGR